MEAIDRSIENLIPAEYFYGYSPSLIIFFTVVILFLLKLALSWTSKQRRTARDILILGCCDSGKTSLFLKLCSPEAVSNGSTVSSQKPNETTASIILENTPTQVKVIDYPGHNRLRDGVQKYLNDVAGIIFLVDANVDRPEFTKSADLLYYLFTDKTINKYQIPIHIACNKSEMLTHRKAENIKEILESELSLIRDSQSSQPGRQEVDEQPIYLGIEGQQFKMDQLEFDVQFSNISIKDDNLNRQSVLEFIKDSIME
jgi:signal recognition particle receptor subunit beta